MRDNLPSLRALRAFESAARHLSMTRAGLELHVTPGAVSLHIRDLEQQLGIILFRRNGRGLALTPAGEAYFSSLSTAFRLIKDATESLRHEKRSHVLTLSCTSGFATHWLLPRLPHFERTFPGIDLRISATSRIQSFVTDEIDLAVRHGNGRYEGAVSEKLLDEEYIAVCTPAVAARLGPPPSLSALRHVTLLHDMHRDDWRRWLSGAGGVSADADRGPVFSDGSGAWLAMLSGEGIALMRRGFVGEKLTSGEIISPFEQTLNSGHAYWLVYPPDALTRPAVAKVRGWLKENCILGHD